MKRREFITAARESHGRSRRARSRRPYAAGRPAGGALTQAFQNKGIGMAGPEDITFFSAVDRTKEPDFFRRFLDEGNKVPGIIASKPIILAGLQLTGGEKVLDVGCGLGDDTFEIARLVGRQGRAIGVDVSKSMILEARHRAAAHDLAAEFEVGDAQALRFEDATFDACHPAETPSDWVTTSTPVSARFTVAISSASPAIFSSFGWSTGILRADRASARTECPP